MLLYLSSGRCGGVWDPQWPDRCPDLAGEVTLEASDDFGLGLAFGDSALEVDLRGLVVLHTDDHGTIEGSVGMAVTAAV